MNTKNEASKGAPEFHPDGWERFESAVDKALRTPPAHRTEAKTGKTHSPAKRDRSSHASSAKP